MCTHMLGIYGIAPSDYTPVYVNYNDGFSALGDSNVDAAIVNSAPPIPGIKELAIRKSIRLLPVSDDKRKAFLEKYAYYRAGILKKSVYDTAQDVVTLGTYLIAVGVQGYSIARHGWIERLIAFAGGLLLVKPGLTSDAIGLICLVVVIGLAAWRRRREPKPAAGVT